MLKIVESQRGRVVPFRSPDRKSSGGSRDTGVALGPVLKILRAELNELAISLARERGRTSESAARAEQASHAIERLEWALAREQGHPPAG